MLRLNAVNTAGTLLFVIACGSANDEGLFGPPNPGAWKGGVPSTGGSAITGGGGATGSGGATAAGGTSDAGGAKPTGGVSPGTGGLGGSGGMGGTGGTLDPPVGGQGGVPDKASPGVISCAGIPCRSDTNPANTCCVGLPGFPTYCRPEFVACSFAAASPFYCDDAADCGGGALCCGTTDGGFPSSICAAECNGGGSTVQLCRTNAECTNERRCKPWNELPEYSSCQ